jgi:hypothetical protein
MDKSSILPKKTIKSLITDYIDKMDDKTRQTYDIAKEHLESSFDITKSIGFKQYIKSLPNNKYTD